MINVSLRSFFLGPVFFAAAMMALKVDASVSLSVGADGLQTQIAATPFPADALIQLVDLGADGVFNSIILNDGGSQWVSGDDQLLGLVFEPADAPFDTDHFDVKQGEGTETAGFLTRLFQLNLGGQLAVGDKLGIRWYPSILATSFDASGSALSGGVPYGQFSRQGLAIYDGTTTWVVPADGSTVTFDPLITVGRGGLDLDELGRASFVVIPEPSVAALGGLGVIGLAIRRRRK